MRKIFSKLLSFGKPEPHVEIDDAFLSCELNQMIFPNEMPQKFVAEDLQQLDFISKGGFGQVYLMKYTKNGKLLAVKKIRVLMNRHNDTETQTTAKRLKNEIKAIRTGNICPYIVQFYGALMTEGDCWICMELMSTSLRHLYKTVYERNEIVPEDIIGFTNLSVLSALHFLKTSSNIMHRDIKPENILLNNKGNIKLCDFGISGVLIKSLVKSHVGTFAYLPPERINVETDAADKSYGVESDVWSLGITLYEVAVGRLPYNVDEKMKIFQVEILIKNSPAPEMPADNPYSVYFKRFVDLCLEKDLNKRPKYDRLMAESFYLNYAQRLDACKTVGNYVKGVSL